MVEQPIQSESSGSNPTSPLHFSKVDRNYVKSFIENNHYSHSINGCMSTICFAVHLQGKLVGAALFGKTAMPNVVQKYGNNVLELRRLVLSDCCPKNSESRFIGFCLRYIKKNMKDVDGVLSYADPNAGHTGVIYRAANFEYRGQTAPVTKLLYEGKLYHDRSPKVKYWKGKLKGQLKPFAKRLKEAISRGEVKKVQSLPKHRYFYSFVRDRVT